MVKEIVHDIFFLGIKSKPADENDIQTAYDLLDTLKAHSFECVGMAANMIGVAKSIIVFDDNGVYTVMFNPEIISRSGIYETEEGCLSLSGMRKTKRYQKIKVRYQNIDLKPRIKTYTDYTAQIIQHEIDHINGIII